MKTGKQNIRHLSHEQLKDYCEKEGEKPFRAGQIYSWIWQKHARGFEEMTNLSLGLRTKLAGEFTLPAVNIDTTQHSSDGTLKSRFVLHDGELVEGVLIPTETRTTACVSSQVGCSLSCRFCATGFMERKRNLEFDEIYDEVALINRQSLESYGKKLTNIVFMGMGEPLLNYKNVLRSVDRITAEDGLAMSPKRITVSTAGVSKMIRQLGDDKVRFNLALSLHAANDKKRSEIMPVNDTNHLKALIEALNYFYQQTKNDISFEYILFKNFNDSLKDADELIRIYRQAPVKVVNIIEYNPVEKAHFSRPDETAATAFMDYLSAHRVNTRLRRSRGKDIDAACGQLANK